MAKVFVSTVVDAPAAQVWAVIRDFNGLPAWTPFAAESRIEQNARADQVGCIRNFRLRDGGVIRERLLALSDYDFAMTYAILHDTTLPEPWSDWRIEAILDSAPCAGPCTGIDPAFGGCDEVSGWRGESRILPRAAAFGCLVFALYLSNGRTVTEGDVMPTMLLPIAILRGDGPYLDRFASLLGPRGERCHGVAYARGHLVSRYPIAPALAALPTTAVQMAALDRRRPSWSRGGPSCSSSAACPTGSSRR